MLTLKNIWAIIALTTVPVASIISNAPIHVTAIMSIGIMFVLGIAFGNKHANLLGALTAAGFGYLSYSQGLYGNAFVNWLFVIPMSLYGWWSWCQNDKNSGVAEKRKIDMAKFNWVILGTATITAIVYLLILSLPEGVVLFKAPIPIDSILLDAVTTTLPVAATLLLVNSYREQWYLWVPYNLLEVVLWLLVYTTNPTLLPILIMRIVFFVNSLIGTYEWNKK